MTGLSLSVPLALTLPLLLAGYGFSCTELTCTSVWPSTIAPVLALAGVSLFMAAIGLLTLMPRRAGRHAR